MLLVDDGSTDGSAAWAAARAEQDPRLKLLRLSRNFGHQLAITAGMDHADGDAVVIMDADLQDPPEVIPELLRAWRGGTRSPTRCAPAAAASPAQALPGRHLLQDVPPDGERGRAARHGDFRLVDRKVVDALKQVRELHRFVRGLTCWVGYSQTAVRYERAPRHAGVTKYPIWKLMRLAWDGVTSFSSAPLRWMTLIGLLVSIAGLAQAVRVIVGRLLYPGTMERGWATTRRDHAVPGRSPARLARADRTVRRPDFRGEQETAALLRQGESRARRASGGRSLASSMRQANT